MIEPAALAPSRTANGSHPFNGSTGHAAGSDNGETTVTGPGATDQRTVGEEVRVLFGKLSGLDLARADGGASFLELGFDSLMLTHASGAIEKQFGVRIGFGQLLAKYSTFDLLEAYLQARPESDKNFSSVPPEAGALPRMNGAVGEDVTPWTPGIKTEQSTA
jgi:acyl carrier protein